MNDKQHKETLSRRRLLGTLGMAATGAMMLDDILCAGQNPAANVADRGSSICITGLQAHVSGDRVYMAGADH